MFQSHSAQRNRFLLTIILMLSVLTFVMFAFAYQVRGDGENPSMPTPSIPTHDLAIIASGQATKIALDAQEDAQQQSARATAVRSDELGTPNPKNLSTTIATSVPMPVATTLAQTLPGNSNGIDFIQSPSSGWINRYKFNNVWSGTVNSLQVSLYAGLKVDSSSTGGSPGQGVILYSAMQSTVPDTEYLTATQHGALTFTDVSGTCLTAMASDGTTFTFDATNHTWSCTP